MKLTSHSQRNLSVIENFILHYTHGEQHPLYDEMMQSAKDYIAEDHVDGEGSEEAFAEKLSELETKEAKKKIAMLEKAKQFLIADTDEEFQTMIDLIANHEDENELIDYIDGVTVWEKVELSFTCKQFMFEITPSPYS